MREREKDQRQSSQPTQNELYGQQGNQGQYGQGQYDSDGNPDPNGAQAQRIIPGSQEPSKSAQSPNPYDHYQTVPHD